MIKIISTCFKTKSLSLLLALLVFAYPAFTQQEDLDETESPYFQVKGEGENIDLPLKSTSVEVKIAGVIADVVIRQVYINNGSKPVEAEYVFPGSTRAAVYGMNMKIGDRTIKAEIKEKQKAQEIFDQAKAEGKSASLLQQHRPNVFQMNVANIQPGESVEVELFYNELLVPEGGMYEFVFPTLVGPRYTDENGIVKDQWVLNPYTNTNATFPKPAFNILVHLNTPLPLQQIISPSHQIAVRYLSEKEADIQLKQPANSQTGKDFIIRYGLSGGKIQSGISLYKGENENFFLAMLEPPKRISKTEIVPREYVFIIDVSGSMNGFPLDITKKLMKDLLYNLQPSDKFNVLLFASSSEVFSEAPVPVNSDNINRAFKFINSEQGYGTTQLLPALKKALALPREEGLSRNIVIATDGYVTVDKEAFDYVSQHLGAANFFPFGIGTDVNRYLIEGLARAGHGEPFIITKTAEAPVQAAKFRKYISFPLLTDIKVSMEGLETYDVEPLTFPDLFAERPILIYGKWKGKPSGKMIIKGVNNEGTFENTYSISKNDLDESSEALTYLWARNRIMRLSDYNSASYNAEYREEITGLGLKYHLLTEFTSFVGVDEQQIEPPMNQAVSGGDVPEPHEWALIIVGLSLVAILIIKNYV